MERYFSPKENISSKRARVEFSDYDIVGDPALRKTIDSYAIGIRDEVIDIISLELENRFTESTSELLSCIACLDPRDSFASFDLLKLLHMAEMYSEDFFVHDQMEMKQQLENYIHEIRRNNDFSNLRDIGGLAKKMVEKKYHTVYPFVYKLLQLALVLPVATATVERSFSAMNIIKTDLRNKMGGGLPQ